MSPIAKLDLVAHIERLREWSRRTFGPAKRTAGILEHIEKEIDEVRATPDNVEEWIDIVILAFDGAWRHGHSPAAIAQALVAKQTIIERRSYPDWRGLPVTLGELLDVLYAQDQKRIVDVGLGNLHSYPHENGSVAFDQQVGVAVRDMLTSALICPNANMDAKVYISSDGYYPLTHRELRRMLK